MARTHEHKGGEKNRGDRGTRRDSSRGYSIGELCELSGVTARTLRHYESLGLISPSRQQNGYRSYDEADVERLQQVLLFRSCGMQLADICSLLNSPSYDAMSALQNHLHALTERREQLDALIATAEKTIANLRGELDMTDRERFEGLKRAAVEKNEREFGAEARERHGDEAIDASNERLLAMDEETWNDMNKLEGAIIDLLVAAMATKDPTSPEAASLAKAHERWIKLHWGEKAYSRKAHLELARAYPKDARFVAYYDDRAGAGATDFLVSAIEANLAE